VNGDPVYYIDWFDNSEWLRYTVNSASKGEIRYDLHTSVMMLSTLATRCWAPLVWLVLEEHLFPCTADPGRLLCVFCLRNISSPSCVSSTGVSFAATPILGTGQGFLSWFLPAVVGAKDAPFPVAVVKERRQSRRQSDVLCTPSVWMILPFAQPR